MSSKSLLNFIKKLTLIIKSFHFPENVFKKPQKRSESLHFSENVFKKPLEAKKASQQLLHRHNNQSTLGSQNSEKKLYLSSFNLRTVDYWV
jgi:peptidoglycan hydrolase CwlO-like protein